MIGIIIQGPSTFVEKQKQAWNAYKDDLVFSTWKGEEKYYNSLDKTIFSDIPDCCGIKNLNLQKHSTLKGIEYFKKLNYNFVLKIRSDLIPKNSKLFLNSFNKEKLNILLFHHHEKGYWVDYFMAGPIDLMYKAWSFDGTKHCNYPEEIITENITINNLPVHVYKNSINQENDLISLKWNHTIYDAWHNDFSWKTE